MLETIVRKSTIIQKLPRFLDFFLYSVLSEESEEVTVDSLLSKSEDTNFFCLSIFDGLQAVGGC